jgi:hypothetical protein
MKQYLFLVLIVTIFCGCQSNQEKILGNWVRFDTYRGFFEELNFSKDEIIVKQFRYGEKPHEEIKREYRIIDDTIVVKKHEQKETFFDSEIFAFFFIKKQLFLSDYYGSFIRYSKIESSKSIPKTKKLFIGNWVYSNGEDKIELEFMKNGTAKIISSNNSNEIISEQIVPFEIDEYYLRMNDPEIFVKGIYFYDGAIFYKINKDTLFLFEALGGEIDPSSFYFEKTK